MLIRSYVLPRVMLLLLVAASLACSLGSGLGSSGGGSASSADGAAVGDLALVADELPTFNPGAPPPSPGAAALRALSVLDPSVTELESDVEAAERAALDAVVADLQAQLAAGNGLDVPFLATQPGGTKVAILVTGSSARVAYAFLGDPDAPINTTHDAALIAALVSGLGDILTANVEAGAGTGGSATEREGGATTTASLEIGRGADNTTKFGVGSQTEAVKDGVSTKVVFAASVDGQRCPNADGQVSFTVKVRLGAESGGAGYTQDLTAFVRAVVGDDARIVSTTIDATQGTRQVKDGRQVYVESGFTVKAEGEGYARNTITNLRLVRASQEATLTDIRGLAEAGHEAAFAIGASSLALARDAWLNGGCTKIEANSPGTVEPGSSTAIPVTVRHRFEGSVLASKLKAELAGAESVDPVSLAKTPGTLTYTAPDESGTSATITLTATSRRGQAKLELGANTGGQAYRAIAPQPAVWSGVACSLDKPFAFSYTGLNSGSYSFVPSSATRGQVAWHDTFASCETTASGTYVIEPYPSGGQSDIIMDLSGTGICQGFSSPTGEMRLHVLLEKISEPSCP